MITTTDVYNVGVSYNVVPPTQAGLDMLLAAIQSLPAGRHALQLQNTKVAALLAAWKGAEYGIANNITDADLLPNMLLQLDSQANTSDFYGMWQDLPADTVATYVNTAPMFLTVFYNMSGRSADAGSQPDPLSSARYAFNAAIAGPLVTLPDGIKYLGSYPAIPAAWIVEGPTELPDGNKFIAITDPLNGYHVQWWKGPRWIAPTISDVTTGPDKPSARNPWVRVLGYVPGQLFDAGTGDWYLNAAMGVRPNDGTGTLYNPQIPATFTGAFTLPPRALASLQVGGQDPGVPIPGPVSTPSAPLDPTQGNTNAPAPGIPGQPGVTVISNPPPVLIQPSGGGNAPQAGGSAPGASDAPAAAGAPSLTDGQMTALALVLLGLALLLGGL